MIEVMIWIGGFGVGLLTGVILMLHADTGWGGNKVMSNIDPMTRAIELLEEAPAAALRALVIEECVKAARDGFEAAMDKYVLIGPSGMAMMMINSIKALMKE